MNIDPLKFMMQTIKAVPGLPADVSVNADLDLHAPGSRAIDVVLVGGPGRVVRDRMDAFTFSLNHYGPTKGAAIETAFLVRRYLLEVLPNTAHPNGVAVSDVEELSAPHDFGDDKSHEQRFIHEVTIYVYEY